MREVAVQKGANFPVEWAVPSASWHGYARNTGAVSNWAPQNPETNTTMPTPPRNRQSPAQGGTVVQHGAGMTGISARQNPETSTTMPTPP